MARPSSLGQSLYRHILWAAVLGICMSLTAPVGSGQTVNASLSGTVTDASGALVPEVSVTAANTETGVATKTTSDPSGHYTLPSLSPGTYNLTFGKEGFSSTVINGVTLQVDQQATLDATLKVGSTSQQVVVTGEAPIVNTESATVGTVIDTRQVLDLPLNLREFGSLATLVPGAITDNGGFASSTIGSPFSQTSYNSNGNRSSSNNFLIDGVMSRNLSFGGFALSPPPDAIQEFNLETNIYDASFGLAAGSTINLATKSGTNQIHGAAYDFLRNSDLDARNFFSLNNTNPVTGAEIPGSARPTFRRNQFGGVLGGPIKKDKTFWFGNYEGLRRTEGGIALNTVPTPAELSGNFAAALTGKMINLCGAGGPANLNFDTGQIFNPATVKSYTCPGGSTILVGTPVPGNIITNIDPVAAHTLSLNPFPASNYPTVTNFAQTSPTTERDDQFNVRVDHNFNEKNQIFGRYMFGQSTWNDPYTGYSSLPTFGDTLYYRGQNIAFGWTHSVNPNILNEVRLGFQRDWNDENCASCPRAPNFMSSFGIQNLNGYSANSIGFPIFSFTNYSTIGDSEYRPVISPDMVETYGDTLTWTHGQHSTKAGATLQFYQILGEQAAFSPHGQLNFSGQYSGLGLNEGINPTIPIGGQAVGVADLADFLQGYPNSANETLRYLGTNQAGGKFWAFFGQDDWKLRPDLTLNLGLRWEYRGWPYDKRNNFVSYVPTGPAFSGPGDALLVSSEPNAINDAYCSNPQYSFLISPTTGQCLLANSAERASFGFTGGTRSSLVFPYHKDFDPRLGVAWKPTKSDKLVVRAGAGVFTDLGNFNNTHFVNNNPLNGTSISYIAPGAAPPEVVNGSIVTSQNVLAVGGTPALSNQFISLYISPHFKPPQVVEWSFGIQSELAQNWAVEADYVGNKAYHEGYLHLPGNQPLPTNPALGAAGQQANRPYPDFGEFLYTSSDAKSNYNSLQLKLTKRFSQGFTFLAGYTWQATFDNNEGDEGFGGALSQTDGQNDNCIPCNYGPSYDDAHQRFVLSGVWELPLGRGQRWLNYGGVVDEIVGGWRASGIYSRQTGFPFPVVSGIDYSNSQSANLFADRVCNGNNGPQTVQKWFDTSCFSIDALKAAELAGTPRYGNQQRNDLIGPPFHNIDFALLKDFSLSERFKLQFRAESYNTINTTSFGYPTNNVLSGSYGQITGTSNSNREIQFALKLLF
ncbi:MAG TPA: carboxypeptidase regulatory-like domain-containing protein [Terriglobia bacterium]|nr:carboxypeptidase regulatory-like domain-containing protein [Terriglobia bacterium]